MSGTDATPRKMYEPFSGPNDPLVALSTEWQAWMKWSGATALTTVVKFFKEKGYRIVKETEL